jgi:hypothetical protein
MYSVDRLRTRLVMREWKTNPECRACLFPLRLPPHVLSALAIAKVEPQHPIFQGPKLSRIIDATRTQVQMVLY